MKKILEGITKLQQERAIKQGKKFFRNEYKESLNAIPLDNMVMLTFIADENNTVSYVLASRKTYPNSTLQQIAGDEIVKKSAFVNLATSVYGRSSGVRRVPVGELSAKKIGVLLLAAQLAVKRDGAMGKAMIRVKRTMLKSIKRANMEAEIAPICIFLASLLAIPIIIIKQHVAAETIVSVIQVLAAATGSLIYLKYKERLLAALGYFLVAAGVINIIYLLL